MGICDLSDVDYSSLPVQHNYVISGRLISALPVDLNLESISPILFQMHHSCSSRQHYEQRSVYPTVGHRCVIDVIVLWTAGLWSRPCGKCLEGGSVAVRRMRCRGVLLKEGFCSLYPRIVFQRFFIFGFFIFAMDTRCTICRMFFLTKCHGLYALPMVSCRTGVGEIASVSSNRGDAAL